MLDICFIIGGRKLDPCFIGDSVEKATLLSVARKLKQRFRDIVVPDCEDPLRITVQGEDVSHLRYQLEGSQFVMRQVRDRTGDLSTEDTVLSA